MKNKFKDRNFILGFIGAPLLGFFMGYNYGFVGVVGGAGFVFLFAGLYNRTK